MRNPVTAPTPPGTTSEGGRERPILFSGAMVRALLDGSKTQTRRVAMHTVCGVRLARLAVDPAPELSDCPYGQPGDRLWVRETWFDNQCPRDFGDYNRDHLYYRADGGFADQFEQVEDNPRWKPSIHMPRWASRLTLEVTGVRVERVQDISEADAKAEGCQPASDPDDCTADDGALNAECGYFPPRTYVDGYRLLWDSLNASRGYGWDANPWVWCISFRLLSALPHSTEPSDAR